MTPGETWNAAVNLLCLSLCKFCAEKQHTHQVSKCPYTHKQQNPELAWLNTRRVFSFQNTSSPTQDSASWEEPRRTPCLFSRRLCCSSSSSSSSLAGLVMLRVASCQPLVGQGAGSHMYAEGPRQCLASGCALRAAAHVAFPSRYFSEVLVTCPGAG